MMNEINPADENVIMFGQKDDGMFVDIKIDSDNENDQKNESKLKQSSNSKLTDKFFNFNKNKTKRTNNFKSDQSKVVAEVSTTSSTSSCSTNSSCSSPSALATNTSSNKNTNSTNQITKTLSLNERADLLLSNLNEMKLRSYDDEDDFEEDEEDDDDDFDNANISTTILNNEKRASLYELKLNNDLKYDDFLKQKEANLFNSTLISSLQSISSINNPASSDVTLDADSLKMSEDQALTDISLNDNTPTPQDNELNNEKDLILMDENNNSVSKLNNIKLSSLRANSNPSQNVTNNKSNLKLMKNFSHPFNAYRSDSLVEGLLGDIYDRFNITTKENIDSDVFTELSCSRFSGCDSTVDHDTETKYYSKFYKLARSTLQAFSITELRNLVNEMTTETNQISIRMIKQLKQKDKLISKLNRSCDVLTAMLQARSLKRRVDTQMKFTLNPMPGEIGFAQWKDAMKALARLPGGVPKEFRKSIWLNLSKKYIQDINLDWDRVRRLAFNDRSNPDDDELGIQIVKDLHRTGCSAFSGQENEQDRALLKRVLLAFARYNKSVGYCQGFNIIAALILEIVEKKAEDAFMCMIYLIDHILPEGYFTNSMHTLAIDMAVFRELLKIKLPKLCHHLNALQYNSITTDSGNKNSKYNLFSSTKNKKVSSSGGGTLHHSKTSTNSLSTATSLSTSYEPPLTNVFTMQWFLTLFATCLPKNSLLRVWDCIFLEGSEILFRTSIAIWEKLSTSIMKANSADAFYSMMSILSIKLFDQNVIDENELINKIYSYGAFPFPGLEELREKFTFNITPFQTIANNNSEKDLTSKEGLSHLKLNNKSSSMSSLTDYDLLSQNATNKDNHSGNNLISPKLSKINIDNDKKLNHSSNMNDNLTFRRIYDEDKNNNTDIEDDEVEDLAKMISCFALLMPNRQVSNSITSSGQTIGANHQTRNDIMMTAAAAASAFSSNPKSMFSSLNKALKNEKNKKLNSKAPNDISTVTPGAFSFISQMYNPKPLSEHLTLDMNELKSQYKKIKERQRQAHIIIQAATAHNMQKLAASSSAKPTQQTATSQINRSPFMLEKPPIVNHLLIKPNDPNCNTLKKSIQLSTDDSLIESLANNRTSSIETFAKMNTKKALLEKMLSVPDQFNHDKTPSSSSADSSKLKKTKKPYYSDDEDDDDDDDDDEESIHEYEEKLNENYLAKNQHKIDNTYEALPNIIKLDDKTKNLIDLNDSFNMDKFSNNYLKVESSSGSSTASQSSSSTSSSPGTNKKNNNSSKYNYNLNVNNFSSASSLLLQSDMHPITSNDKSSAITNKKSLAKHQTTKSNSLHKHHQITTSTIINNLVNEEKKHSVISNPFPVKNINSTVAKNGLRLGLYK